MEKLEVQTKSTKLTLWFCSADCGQTFYDSLYLSGLFSTWTQQKENELTARSLLSGEGLQGESTLPTGLPGPRLTLPTAGFMTVPLCETQFLHL